MRKPEGPNLGPWQSATGTTNWAHTVTLSLGSNSIEARSKDAANNYSIANGTVSVTYSPVPTGGSLQVTIGPLEVMAAGAQWRVDGASWQNNAEVAAQLSVGAHVVSFKDVSGWITPLNQTVMVTADQTVSASGTYQRRSTEVEPEQEIPQTPACGVGLCGAGGTGFMTLVFSALALLKTDVRRRPRWRR